LGGLGSFAGLFALPAGRWRQPVLVSGADGVGTKTLVASLAGHYDTVGIDLVAMCVDDLVCAGARPLFLLDYLSMRRLDATVVEAVVAGVAEGCRQVGAALLGGEMAEHPSEGGLQRGSGGAGPEDGGGQVLDLAGFAVGAVERQDRLGPEKVRAGDVLVGLASPGLRCNGYSLAGAALLRRGQRSLDGPAWSGASRSLGDELLVPSALYAPAVLAAAAGGDLHAAAHVTGGGLRSNLARALPLDCDAVVEVGSWEVPRIFGEVRDVGAIGTGEMARTFNMGLGMVLVVEGGGGSAAVSALRSRGHDAWVAGDVRQGSGHVHLAGEWRWASG
ncbi:MAG: phosphoribosylformylglycinamidine cyclo-ligase, partial [Acidimicrobiales bacterium]